MISEDLCRYLIKLAHKYDKKVIIDPKGKNWEKYSGADIVTPNVKELSDIVGYTVPNTDRAIEKAAREAITNNHLTALLVTRSDKGMSLIGPIPPIHIPTHSEEVFDVSGAGDRREENRYSYAYHRRISTTKIKNPVPFLKIFVSAGNRIFYLPLHIPIKY